MNSLKALRRTSLFHCYRSQYIALKRFIDIVAMMVVIVFLAVIEMFSVISLCDRSFAIKLL